MRNLRCIKITVHVTDDTPDSGMAAGLAPAAVLADMFAMFDGPILFKRGENESIGPETFGCNLETI